ncbi:MAG: OmpA family protein [Proteobacteria bacterium]|nr:OmpA family protein [Pseudomonadota bacterium]
MHNSGGLAEPNGVYTEGPEYNTDLATEKVVPVRSTRNGGFGGPNGVYDQASKGNNIATEKFLPARPTKPTGSAVVEMPARKTQRSRGGLIPWVLLALVVVGAGSGEYYMFEKYQIARDDLTEAQKTIHTARQGVVEADHKIMTLEAELSRTRGEFEAARKRAGEENSASLAAKLEAVLPADKSELVFGSGGRLNLALADELLFKQGKSELSAAGKTLFDRIGRVLNEFPDEQVWVYGHTGSDSTKRDKSPWELSASRALTVIHYLQKQVSLDPSRLAAVALGSRSPGPRRANRISQSPRIELVLFPRNAH